MIFNNGKFFVGFTLGFGTGLLARDAYPYVTRAVKPLGKQTLKFGITSLEKARESLSRLGEILEDLTEEVKFELINRTRKSPEKSPSPKRKKAKTSPVGELSERRTA
jgi:hypothetical protein